MASSPRAWNRDRLQQRQHRRVSSDSAFVPSQSGMLERFEYGDHRTLCCACQEQAERVKAWA